MCKLTATHTRATQSSITGDSNARPIISPNCSVQQKQPGVSEEGTEEEVAHIISLKVEKAKALFKLEANYFQK